MVDVGLVVVGVLVAAVGGFVGLRQANRQWAIRREIKSTESMSAGELRRGVVELSGTAEPAGETLTAPLTGRECLAYRYEVERRRRKRSHDSSKKTTWNEIKSEERAVPFYVDDGVGRALVDAPVAEFRLEQAHGVETDDGTIRPTGRLKALVTGEDAGYDMPITDRVKAEAEAADNKRRYREYVILPEESVYVYGEGMRPEEARSGETGLSTVAGILGSLGLSPLSTVVRMVTGATGDRAEFRRSSRRPQGQIDGDFDVQSEFEDSMAELEQHREKLERRQDRLERLAQRIDENPEEMTSAERRRLQEEFEELTPDADAESMLDSLQSHLGTVVEPNRESGDVDTNGGDDADPFAEEHLVISRGDTIGEFVVSDREKGSVVRSYTKSTLKWLGVALACIAVGAFVVANALGVGPFGGAGSRAATLVPAAVSAGVAGRPASAFVSAFRETPPSGSAGPAGRSTVDWGDS